MEENDEILAHKVAEKGINERHLTRWEMIEGAYYYMGLDHPFDWFNIPYDEIKVMKNGRVKDVIHKVKRKAYISLLKYRAYREVRLYKLHSKETDMYYVMWTTMKNIIKNNNLLPKFKLINIEYSFDKSYDILIEGVSLSYDDKLHLQRHHPDCPLGESLQLLGYVCDSIDINEYNRNGDIIGRIQMSVWSQTIGDILTYL